MSDLKHGIQSRRPDARKEKFEVHRVRRVTRKDEAGSCRGQNLPDLSGLVSKIDRCDACSEDLSLRSPLLACPIEKRYTRPLGIWISGTASSSYLELRLTSVLRRLEDTSGIKGCKSRYVSGLDGMVPRFLEIEACRASESDVL